MVPDDPATFASPACDIRERYEKLAKLGEGEYGVVYKARNKITGEIVALKKTKPRVQQTVHHEEGIPATAIREISLLRELEHPNIVMLKEAMYGEGTVYLVFEYVEFDLRQVLDSVRDGQRPPLKALLVKSFLYQLLQGAKFCHQRRVLHRDLKPSNLLVDRRGTLKLADFGLARSMGVAIQALTREVVSLCYRAPELLLGMQHYSIGIDIWAIGCIFAEMVRATPLFCGGTEYTQLLAIFSVLGTPDDVVWPGVTAFETFPHMEEHFPPLPLADLVPLDVDGLDLLSRMLSYNPHNRISTAAALDHCYFDDLKALKAQAAVRAPNEPRPEPWQEES